MHSVDIMYTDWVELLEAESRQPRRQYPELFTVHYNGDFSGDIKINMEDWHVELIEEADGPGARHGHAIVQVELPFEVVARIVAAYVINEKVHRLETLDDSRHWKEALGL